MTWTEISIHSIKRHVFTGKNKCLPTNGACAFLRIDQKGCQEQFQRKSHFCLFTQPQSYAYIEVQSAEKDPNILDSSPSHKNEILQLQPVLVKLFFKCGICLLFLNSKLTEIPILACCTVTLNKTLDGMGAFCLSFLFRCSPAKCARRM